MQVSYYPDCFVDFPEGRSFPMANFPVCGTSSLPRAA
jgi:hypothetical protein